MAYTPYTPVGSNLTDLGRLLEAGEARSAATDLQRMSLMFQNAQKKADLESRRAENEADRKLKYFEVDQRKALQTRSLDLEDKRLASEADRWFAGHGLKDREVSAYEKQLNAVDPRVARDTAALAAQIEERNARAKSAASRANVMLQSILRSEPERIKMRASEWFTNTPRATSEAKLKTEAEIDEIFTKLGEDAEFVQLSPDRRMFLPLEIGGQAPQRPNATAQQFFGRPAMPPASDRPFTLIPEGYPAQPAMQFPTREALDAYSNRGTNAAPVLLYNPQTGTFE